MSDMMTLGQLRAALAAIPGAMDGDSTNVVELTILPEPVRVNLRLGNNVVKLSEEEHSLKKAVGKLQSENNHARGAGEKLHFRLKCLRAQVRTRAPKLP